MFSGKSLERGPVVRTTLNLGHRPTVELGRDVASL